MWKQARFRERPAFDPYVKRASLGRSVLERLLFLGGLRRRLGFHGGVFRRGGEALAPDAVFALDLLLEGVDPVLAVAVHRVLDLLQDRLRFLEDEVALADPLAEGADAGVDRVADVLQVVTLTERAALVPAAGGDVREVLLEPVDRSREPERIQDADRDGQRQ